jgi:REP element-mobilizing transposase RayT
MFKALLLSIRYDLSDVKLAQHNNSRFKRVTIVTLAKGRSSCKIQQEFEHIRKHYWGQRFWARGYFSTTSGNITDDVIINYLDKHTRPNGFTPAP